MGDFIAGAVLSFLITSALFVVILPDASGKIDKTCQGTPWVIEETFIKKTLTCVVEVNK